MVFIWSYLSLWLLIRSFENIYGAKLTRMADYITTGICIRVDLRDARHASSKTLKILGVELDRSLECLLFPSFCLRVGLVNTSHVSEQVSKLARPTNESYTHHIGTDRKTVRTALRICSLISWSELAIIEDFVGFGLLIRRERGIHFTRIDEKRRPRCREISLQVGDLEQGRVRDDADVSDVVEG